MLFGIVATMMMSQVSQGPPEPTWLWSEMFGQRVQVYGRLTAQGTVEYNPANFGMIAPVAAERRAAAARDDKPAGPSPNYGLLVDQLADDDRVIRASDPETLRLVAGDVAGRKPCRPDDDDDDLGRKPGIIERAEMDVEKLLFYAVAVCLAVAAIVVVSRSNQTKS